MEVSAIGTAQVKIRRTEVGQKDSRLGFFENDGFRKLLLKKPNNGLFGFQIQTTRLRERGLRLTVKAAQLYPVVKSSSAAPTKSPGNVRLFVGLPLDAVSDCGTVKHERAIAVGLRALKLLGVEGVELPIWWGMVEKYEMGRYNWSGYLALADMVQIAGLKLHISLCFHASTEPNIPLPNWVTRIGESDASIFYTDGSGQQCRDCLSLAVDDIPVLGGKTPLRVYHEFCQSFKSIFSAFLGSTISGISMGLGPDGKLQYPSNHRQANSTRTCLGVGEFLSYDRNMLNLLKQHAEANGNSLWGLGGQDDVLNYDQPPNSSSFFNDNGGSCETPYSDFFLTSYSGQLISHGNRVLCLASSVFADTGIDIHGKLPLMHSWYKTRSRPSELTSGFYNTETRDGYQEVVEMFARNSCKMTLPGMDLYHEHQPHESLSSPESLLEQIRNACRQHGVEISWQNISTGVGDGLKQMKKSITREAVDLFTYQRMGAYFFSPEHFPSFTKFVRSLNQPEMDSDNLLREEEATESVHVTSSTSSNSMQRA